MTGKKGLKYQEAILTLRDMSVNRNEQAKVLYEAIQTQQTQIHLQQQIISCLEYRHVLEELPNTESTMSTPPMLKHGHAVAWKTTWRLAVECELNEMIKIHIKPLPTESTAATSIESKRSKLRNFLQYDFEHWVKDSTQLKEAIKIGEIKAKEKKDGQTDSKPLTPPDVDTRSLKIPFNSGGSDVDISPTGFTENTVEPDITDTSNPISPIDAQQPQDTGAPRTTDPESTSNTHVSSDIHTGEDQDTGTKGTTDTETMSKTHAPSDTHTGKDKHIVSRSTRTKPSQYKSTGNFFFVNISNPITKRSQAFNVETACITT